MNLILTIFLFSLLSISVRNVEATFDPLKIVSSGLDIWESRQNPNRLFKSLLDFVSLITSGGSDSEEDLRVIRSTLTSMNNKLDDISEDLKDFREELMNKLEELNLNNIVRSRLETFFNLGADLDRYYVRFGQVYKAKYTREFNEFMNDVRAFNGGVQDILTKMNNALSFNSWNSNTFDLLSNEAILSSLVCSRGRSQQLVILDLYKAHFAAEIKGMIMDLFAIKVLAKAEIEMTWEIKNVKEEFVRRSKQALSAVKKAASKASREFWACDSNPQEGVTFEKFGPFIYMSFEPEASLALKTGRSCIGDCPRFDKADSSCFVSPSRDDCYSFANHCSGYIRSCSSFDSHIEICNSRHGNQRKYEYVKGDNGKFLGKHKRSCDGTVTQFHSYYEGFWMCQVCLCTCENPDSNLDIYVNLREVVSDVDQNKVVVGVRLKKIDKIFYLQIQQAVLLPSGIVDKKTKSWKRVNTYNIADSNLRYGADYIRLYWDGRSFLLENIEFSSKSVVTGVKFTHVAGYTFLEVRGHKFDFKQGKLTIPNFSWKNNIESASNIRELQLHHLDLPSDYSNNRIHSYSEQFVKLTTSSVNTDVGQSIVPFLDIQPVESKHLTPLSGVGLFHKSHLQGAAGYLTLKIFSYDYKIKM